MTYEFIFVSICDYYFSGILSRDIEFGTFGYRNLIVVVNRVVTIFY